MGSFTSGEVRILSANQPNGKFEVFVPRTKDVQYSIDHHKERFYVLLKDNDHKNYQLLEAPLKSHTDRKNLERSHCYDPQTKIEGFEVFEKYLAVTERNKGLLKIRVIDLATQTEQIRGFSGTRLYRLSQRNA